MEIIHSSEIPWRVPYWQEALSELVRIAWTGSDGICYFPYMPFTTHAFWRDKIIHEWAAERLHSWIVLHEGKVVAHAALVKRSNYWELGRLVSHDPPPGAVVDLCRSRMSYVRQHKLRVVAECTQAHNRTQFLSALMGLRFAGIGLLEKTADGIWWDIVYYDNHPAAPFEPRAGVLAEPLGQELRCQPHNLERLRQIPLILGTSSIVEFPPRAFNVLPAHLDRVRAIVRFNT